MNSEHKALRSCSINISGGIKLNVNCQNEIISFGMIDGHKMIK